MTKNYWIFIILEIKYFNVDLIILFIHGVLIGILASMPVGAIAIMAIQKTLSKGMVVGFVIGLGAAIADLLYASVAAYGISFIADFLVKNKIIIAFFGSIFLMIMGVKIYRSDTIKQLRSQHRDKKNHLNVFLYSFLIALSNPITVIGFGSFFATFGVAAQATTFWQITLLLFGLFVGSLFWWFSVSFMVNKFRKKITLKSIIIINKISGLLIFLIGFGLFIYVLFQ